MIDLPLREEEILVDLDEEDYPDLKLRMKTLTDGEAAKLMGGAVRTRAAQQEGVEDVVEIDMPYGPMMDLFREKVLGVEGEGIQVGGQPFDPKNPAHVSSLPMTWKIRAMGKLVTYATTLPKETEKN